MPQQSAQARGLQALQLEIQSPGSVPRSLQAGVEVAEHLPNLAPLTRLPSPPAIP
ncbi:hypothetical protein CERZMDRAFT_90784 [Cercospora zeae-maydis SCOH1-5]|uniref:Uncharacterized protein n=1 Tax=Cercospora zeae-maydis SCOH1-5 TaxID=717836 RepID=A0A6A6FF69_9PEZI|nr:hypothetical protein CERZMDRAFT_90784 [Cercospora zeae-maydis SCOH1-5]